MLHQLLTAIYLSNNPCIENSYLAHLHVICQRGTSFSIWYADCEDGNWHCLRLYKVSLSFVLWSWQKKDKNIPAGWLCNVMRIYFYTWKHYIQNRFGMISQKVTSIFCLHLGNLSMLHVLITGARLKRTLVGTSVKISAQYLHSRIYAFHSNCPCFFF